MAAITRHACSSFYQLFVIFTVALIPCTLNRNAAHGAFAAAHSTTVVNTATVEQTTATKSANDFDLHAAHLSIDSLLMSSDEDYDLAQLTFEPSLLNFDELSVGETANRVVTIFNRHANRSVYLGSISGSVSDFYSSYFEENLVPPMGNTTFNVVFLPRQQAHIHGHLVIHTSFGVLNYEVSGKGVECPYRLTPLIGLKAPLNATLTPEVYMYNPHDTPLQIVEVYSSGGQFQLELPTSDETNANDKDSTSDSERSQHLWEIPPYCSKPVIRVRFTATTIGNHTAYIRIKVSTKKNADLENTIIVLPIEVEIFREHGLYSNIPFLNFGLGGTNDRPKNVVFKLLNSGKETINVASYSVEAEPEVKNGIALELETTSDAKTNETYQTITATVNWSKIAVERFFRGNILIQTKPKTELRMGDNGRSFAYRVPFVGGILRGSIQFNESLTRFHIARDTNAVNPATTRDFRIKNNFDVALAVTNLTVPAETQPYFQFEHFKARILAPGEESTLFQIVQQPAALTQSVTKLFHLHTNVSLYDIELLSFDGLLRRLLPINEHTVIRLKDVDTAIDEGSINFGILPLSTMSNTMLALVNLNPIPINIQNWKGTISSAAHIGITVPGCSRLSMKGLKFCNNIKPGEWIVFQVAVTSNTVGTFEGKITVQTDYEEINTPIRFSTDMGVLKFTTKTVDRALCFPGGVCTVNLTAYSTFMRTMLVENIHADAIGIHYDYDAHEKPIIFAQGESNIGQLKISIPKVCDDKCALALPDTQPTTTPMNTERNQLLQNKMARFRSMHAKFWKIAFHLQTNHIKRYDFNGSIDLIWPKLVDGPIEFPISQIGHEVIKYINVYNPTNETISAVYRIHDPRHHGLEVELPPEVINECWNCFLTLDSVFSLADTDANKQQINYIPPQSTKKIAVKFFSESAGSYATLLYIENSFTILEAIWLTAKTVVPQFKFGNRKPGSKTPLLFELTDKHLRDCNHPNVNMRAISAKRTFTAKNSGEVPIILQAMRIDDLLCEGYGYRIVDCSPFELAPNGSRKIEISFTPDFTLAMVKKTLFIETSLNYSVNYTLLSMVAPLSLGICSKALARPEWESVMKNVTAGILAIAFVCVIIAAYLDSMKVLKNHIQNMSKAKGSLQPALDLRQIGLKSLFSDDNAKTGNGTLANKQTASVCNGKTNGQLCKKKNAEKKRTVSNENSVSKKSWASEIAKKFTTPRKNEVKVKDVISTKAKQSPASMEKQPMKKDKKVKEEASNLALDDEDSSSTTTEGSNHSDDKSNQIKDKNKKTLPLKEITASQSKDKKNIIKKSKSLPLNYESPDFENVSPVPSSSAKSNKEGSKSSNNEVNPRLPNGLQEETSKELNFTPPSKNYPVKLINGKTPGRERNKSSENVPQRKSSAQENSSFKGTAFQFSSPLSDSPNSGNHPLWDLKKISFSSVVQIPNADPSSSSSSSASPPPQPTSIALQTMKTAAPKSNQRSQKHIGVKIRPENIKSHEQKNSKPKVDDVTRSLFNTNTRDCSEAKVSSQAVDLGPIGTRKSPSSTPIWEPMHSIQNPTPLNLSAQNHLLNNVNNPNSFFSGSFPQNSSYQRPSGGLNEYLNQHQLHTGPDQLNNYSQHHQQRQDLRMLGGTSSLLDNAYGHTLDQQKQSYWDSTLLMNLLQQQQQQQQQQQKLMQREHLRNVATSNASTPMQCVYPPSTNLWNSSNPFDTPQLPCHPDNIWPTSSQSLHEIRPPPGLAHVARDKNRSLIAQNDMAYRQQLQYRLHRQLQMHFQNQAGQQQQPEPQPQQPQQPQQQQGNSTELPPYDPFNSLSSIWSADNWSNANNGHSKKHE